MDDFSWGDTLGNIISTAGAAFSAYELSNSGLTRVPQGTYLQPNGQYATVGVNGVTTSSQSTLLLLVILIASFFGIYAFTRK